MAPLFEGGAQRDLLAALVAVFTFAVTLVGSPIALAAALRPHRVVIALYAVTLFLVLTCHLALLKMGWWAKTLTYSFAEYALAPWLALGCVWMLVAGALILQRRRRQGAPSVPEGDAWVAGAGLLHQGRCTSGHRGHFRDNESRQLRPDATARILHI